MFRGEDNRDRIADEMADVEIMLQQMRLMLDNAEEVDRHIAYKIQRLRSRMEGRCAK